MKVNVWQKLYFFLLHTESCSFSSTNKFIEDSLLRKRASVMRSLEEMSIVVYKRKEGSHSMEQLSSDPMGCQLRLLPHPSLVLKYDSCTSSLQIE